MSASSTRRFNASGRFQVGRMRKLVGVVGVVSACNVIVAIVCAGVGEDWIGLDWIGGGDADGDVGSVGFRADTVYEGNGSIYITKNL